MAVWDRARTMAKATTEAAENAPSTVPRRGRPRSIETSNAILESAYMLMATTGLSSTTIDAVARHSDVSKMTIWIVFHCSAG